MIEAARICADTRRRRTQFDDEVAHLGFGDQRLDRIPAFPARPAVVAEYLPPPARYDPRNPRQAVAWRRDRNSKDRLEQYRLAFRQALVHRDLRRLTEGHIG